MHEVLRAGKARYLACSNYAGWQVVEMHWIAGKHGYAPPVVSQPMYNLLARGIEQEFLPMSKDFKIANIVYNPLAGGFLSGKYAALGEPPSGTRFTLGTTGDLYRDRYWHDAQLQAVRGLSEFLKPRGKSLLQTAIAWVLAQPGITSAIVGASKPEQLDASLAAVNLALDAEEKEACNRAWYRLPRPMGPVR